jgi:hypothetical protein
MYNEIFLANHIKPLITKELTFYSCFSFKQDVFHSNRIGGTFKTLTMHQKRYGILPRIGRGWRSTFSATYKAYNDYDERMKKHTEDLDIAEWHYLMLYFGTKNILGLIEYTLFYK